MAKAFQYVLMPIHTLRQAFSVISPHPLHLPPARLRVISLLGGIKQAILFQDVIHPALAHEQRDGDAGDVCCVDAVASPVPLEGFQEAVADREARCLVATEHAGIALVPAHTTNHL